MTLRAVLIKELRSRMRGWRSPVVLTLYVALMGGLAFVYLQLQRGMADAYYGGNVAALGSQMFSTLSHFQLLLLLFVAPGLTAGSIASERERGTLDLLLCTRLSSLAILLGKLVASLSYAFLLILASLPTFSLAFLFGGVSPKQLLLTFVVSLATAVTFGAVSLFISTVTRRVTLATVASYGVVFLLTAGVSLGSYFAQIQYYISVQGSGLTGPPPTPAITYFNPFAALGSAQAAGSVGLPFLFGLGAFGFSTTPQAPLWVYHLWIDMVAILLFLCLSALLLRPRRWRPAFSKAP